jgi:hypothetical protein
MNIQAHINNISFPKTLEEVYHYITDNGFYDMETLIYDGSNELRSEWTVPKWCQIGDIVLFYHAKKAITTIKRLKKEFILKRNLYTPAEINAFDDAFVRAFNIYDLCGGKIFALAEVIGNPYYSDSSLEGMHFRGKIRSVIGKIFI